MLKHKNVITIHNFKHILYYWKFVSIPKSVWMLIINSFSIWHLNEATASFSLVESNFFLHIIRTPPKTPGLDIPKTHILDGIIFSHAEEIILIDLYDSRVMTSPDFDWFIRERINQSRTQLRNISSVWPKLISSMTLDLATDNPEFFRRRWYQSYSSRVKLFSGNDDTLIEESYVISISKLYLI